ncbi:MAG: VPDSG-CTERM sorting domain-containing protein [Nibricoccus sp.]
MNTIRSIAAAMVVLTSTAISQAVTLVYDTNVALPGTTVAVRPELAGTIIEDDIVSPFQITMASGGLITGSIQERVVRSTATGTLDFYWKVNVDANSAGPLSYFRIGNILGSSYDADWRIDGLGDVGPDSAHLFGGSYTGLGYINFYFSDGLGAGQSSNFMFVHTDATEYDKSGLMDVADAGTVHISQLFNTYAPVTPVPDAGATLMLLGVGLSSLAFLRRRTR